MTTEQRWSGTRVVAVLVGLCAVAWGVTHQLATPDMRVGLLTSAAPAPMAQMGTPQPMTMALGLFMAGWVAMMVAMMVPAVAPVIVTVEHWRRGHGGAPAATLLFVAGYFLVWSALGLAAYALLRALQVWVPPTTSAAPRVGAVLLVVAGVYQLTALKHVCVRHCRAPLALLAQQRTLLIQGRLGPLRMGITHGLYCLGCCWSLMLVLLLLGMMNLAWMAAIAAIIIIEKIVPRGEHMRWLVGLALVGLGFSLAVAPHTLPALGGV